VIERLYPRRRKMRRELVRLGSAVQPLVSLYTISVVNLQIL